MGKRFSRFLAKLSAGYLRFVYATSKVEQKGRLELLYGEEGFAVGFWHGENFCYFPQLQYRGDLIITTVNKRGDIVEEIGRSFGFTAVRLPDGSDSGAGLITLRRMLAGAGNRHLCFSMDGPLGPHHVPSRFFLTAAYLSKKRILPVSVSIKRKLRSKKRWDKYVVPLPFSRLTFTVHQPMDAVKGEFDALAERIVRVMDGAEDGPV